MRPAPVFVLIHSPLVGPRTWSELVSPLRAAGVTVVVPVLSSDPTTATLFWQQHTAAVAAAVAGVDPGRMVLVGHSGAGPLLPAVAQKLGAPPAAYLFVDADLPLAGCSRLDRFGDPGAADAFRGSARDGLLPVWTDDDLAGLISDPTVRAAFVAELQPLPLAVYEEPLPVPLAWPDAPCGYLQCSPVYDGPAVEARALGWPYEHIPAGHFAMLAVPGEVATALIRLAAACGVPV